MRSCATPGRCAPSTSGGCAPSCWTDCAESACSRSKQDGSVRKRTAGEASLEEAQRPARRGPRTRQPTRNAASQGRGSVPPCTRTLDDAVAALLAGPRECTRAPSAPQGVHATHAVGQHSTSTVRKRRLEEIGPVTDDLPANPVWKPWRGKTRETAQAAAHRTARPKCKRAHTKPA